MVQKALVLVVFVFFESYNRAGFGFDLKKHESFNNKTFILFISMKKDVGFDISIDFEQISGLEY